MRNLLKTQAFAEGGKQLTPTERKEFEVTSPNLNDSLQQALAKTRSVRRLLTRALNNRLNAMSPRQRGQLGGSITSAAAGTTPAARGPAVRRRSLSDGRTQYMDANGVTWVE
jgi:hypothetical protein